METILKDGTKVIHLTDTEVNLFLSEDAALKSAFELTNKKEAAKTKFSTDFIKLLEKYSAICKDKVKK